MAHSRAARRPRGSPPSSSVFQSRSARPARRGSSGRPSTTSAPPGSGRCARTSSGKRLAQSLDEAAEDIAALLEILELVVGGAGRRQQHHRARHAIMARLRRCRGDGGRKIAATGERNRTLKRRRKLLGRASDQESTPQASEMGREGLNPACLGQPAGDPVDRGVTQERLFGGIRVGGLGIVDISYAVFCLKKKKSVR